MGKSNVEKRQFACLVGDQLQHFRNLSKLGQGTYGVVYRAESRFLKEVVALKAIDKINIKSQGLWAQHLREVEIHSELKHPAVVELFSTFEDEQKCYFVLECCDADMRHCRPTDEPTVASWIWRIAQGLQYIHNEGVLHLDIKPANLMVTLKGTTVESIKIGDFSLATRQPATSHVICGTPNYMSPEALQGRPPTTACDVWALGCCMYQFLTGRPPFQNRMSSTLPNFNLVIPQHLSPEACDVLKRLLEQDLDKRMTLDELLQHPFITNHVPATQEVAGPLNSIRRLVETRYARALKSSAPSCLSPATELGIYSVTSVSSVISGDSTDPGALLDPQSQTPRAQLPPLELGRFGTQTYNATDIWYRIRNGDLEVKMAGHHFCVSADGQNMWRREGEHAVTYDANAILRDPGLLELHEKAQQVAARLKARKEKVKLSTTYGGSCRLMEDQASFEIRYCSRSRPATCAESSGQDKAANKQDGLAVCYDKSRQRLSLSIWATTPPSYVRRCCQCPKEVIAKSIAYTGRPVLTRMFQPDADLHVSEGAPPLEQLAAVRRWWQANVVRPPEEGPLYWWQHPVITQALDDAAVLLTQVLELNNRPHAAFQQHSNFRVRSSGESGCLTNATPASLTALPPDVLFPLSVVEKRSKGDTAGTGLDVGYASAMSGPSEGSYLSSVGFEDPLRCQSAMASLVSHSVAHLQPLGSQPDGAYGRNQQHPDDDFGCSQSSISVATQLSVQSSGPGTPFVEHTTATPWTVQSGAGVLGQTNPQCPDRSPQSAPCSLSKDTTCAKARAAADERPFRPYIPNLDRRRMLHRPLDGSLDTTNTSSLSSGALSSAPSCTSQSSVSSPAAVPRILSASTSAPRQAPQPSPGADHHASNPAVSVSLPGKLTGRSQPETSSKHRTDDGGGALATERQHNPQVAPPKLHVMAKPPETGCEPNDSEMPFDTLHMNPIYPKRTAEVRHQGRSSDPPYRQQLAKLREMWRQDPNGNWADLVTDIQQSCRQVKEQLLARRSHSQPMRPVNAP